MSTNKKEKQQGICAPSCIHVICNQILFMILFFLSSKMLDVNFAVIIHLNPFLLSLSLRTS